ncbi:MAG: hypothetical protein HY548_01030 [Elusimicrobia bacterium]|nr:hypothetical protein [Elusimicrobiota bacterium]
MTALLSLVSLTGKAWAAVTDALTITVTPNFDYGVDIDTANVTMNLGVVDLAASTWTVKPATMTIVGTWASQEVEVVGSIAGNPAWGFDTDTTNEVDKLITWIVAKPTSDSTIGGGEFVANNFLTGNGTNTTVSTRMGGSGGTGTKFENGGIDLDNMAPGNKAHLWFKLQLPSTTSNGSAANVSYTFTAMQAN